MSQEEVKMSNIKFNQILFILIIIIASFELVNAEMNNKNLVILLNFSTLFSFCGLT